MKLLPRLLISLCMIPAPVLCGELIKGKIHQFICGDNCYLTITDHSGNQRTGLCAAPECVEWNRFTEMPVYLKGQSVEAEISPDGVQFAGDGSEVGRFDAFVKLHIGASPFLTSSPRIKYLARKLGVSEEQAAKMQTTSENYQIAADEPDLVKEYMPVIGLFGFLTALFIIFKLRRHIFRSVEAAMVELGARCITINRNVRRFFVNLIKKMQDRSRTLSHHDD